MAKRATFFISSLRQNHKPYFQYSTITTESQQHQQQQQQQQQQHLISKIAAEVSEIIRTRPRWESTLLSRFPSFNFSDPNFFNEVFKLQNNAFLSLRFFNWVSSNSGITPDPITLKFLFNALVESKAFKPALSILDSFPEIECDPVTLESLIHCLCSDGFLDEGVYLFAKLKILGICPSIVTWERAISMAVKFKRTDVVWGLYGEMMSSGLVADVKIAGCLIEACCIDENVDRGYDLFRQLWGSGIVPDTAVLNKLISGLSKIGKFYRVSEILHLMIETNHNPNNFTYQEIIYGLCKHGKVTEGYRIFKDLRSRGHAPDRVMYTTMIHGLCEARWIKRAERLWFEMKKKKGIKPSKYTYNVLMHAYCRSGALQKALMLQKEMSNKGYKLNLVNYNTLIAGLCKNRKTKKAFVLFEEMSQKGVECDVLTYNSLIRGFCRQKNLAKSQELFKELLAHGLQPSTSSYTPLIEQHCLLKETTLAKELLIDMVNRGVEPSIYNRECIIEGLCREGLPIEGVHWWSEMLDRKLIPRRETFFTLIDSLLHQDELDAALVVLNSMLPLGYELRKTICSRFVRKLCRTNSNQVEMLLQDLISNSSKKRKKRSHIK